MNSSNLVLGHYLLFLTTGLSQKHFKKESYCQTSCSSVVRALVCQLSGPWLISGMSHSESAIAWTQSSTTFLFTTWKLYKVVEDRKTIKYAAIVWKLPKQLKITQFHKVTIHTPTFICRNVHLLGNGRTILFIFTVATTAFELGAYCY